MLLKHSKSPEELMGEGFTITNRHNNLFEKFTGFTSKLADKVLQTIWEDDSERSHLMLHLENGTEQEVRFTDDDLDGANIGFISDFYNGFAVCSLISNGTSTTKCVIKDDGSIVDILGQRFSRPHQYDILPGGYLVITDNYSYDVKSLIHLPTGTEIFEVKDCELITRSGKDDTFFLRKKEHSKKHFPYKDFRQCSILRFNKEYMFSTVEDTIDGKYIALPSYSRRERLNTSGCCFLCTDLKNNIELSGIYSLISGTTSHNSLLDGKTFDGDNAPSFIRGINGSNILALGYHKGSEKKISFLSQDFKELFTTKNLGENYLRYLTRGSNEVDGIFFTKNSVFLSGVGISIVKNGDDIEVKKFKNEVDTLLKDDYGISSGDRSITFSNEDITVITVHGIHKDPKNEIEDIYVHIVFDKNSNMIGTLNSSFKKMDKIAEFSDNVRIIQHSDTKISLIPDNLLNLDEDEYKNLSITINTSDLFLKINELGSGLYESEGQKFFIPEHTNKESLKDYESFIQNSEKVEDIGNGEVKIGKVKFKKKLIFK